MHSLRDEGMAILFISSELEEVVRDSQRGDRVARPDQGRRARRQSDQ